MFVGGCVCLWENVYVCVSVCTCEWGRVCECGQSLWTCWWWGGSWRSGTLPHSAALWRSSWRWASSAWLGTDPRWEGRPSWWWDPGDHKHRDVQSGPLGQECMACSTQTDDTMVFHLGTYGTGQLEDVQTDVQEGLQSEKQSRHITNTHKKSFSDKLFERTTPTISSSYWGIFCGKYLFVLWLCV